MNPFLIAWAMVRRHPATTGIFVIVIAVAIGLGVGIAAQERALRQGSALAADRFDLLVAAPGSPSEVVFNTIFLRPSAVQLLDPAITARALTDVRAEYAAPIGFGDNVQGLQVVGTIAPFVDRLSDGLSEGRLFESHEEAVVGADVPFQIGDKVTPAHGAVSFATEDGEPIEAEGEEGHHHYELTIVGRMQRTGNPWDRAVVVPIETVWEAHSLPNGHDAAHAEQLGPPFDPAQVPGLPAIVMKGKTFADMYGLRGEYRSTESMAFFPAEVLLQLYEIMGNVGRILTVMATATQVLAVLAILAGVFALMKLFERQFAVLRALGASRTYVFAAVWMFASLIVVTGLVLGIGLGWGFANIASSIISRSSGVALIASLGMDEVWLAVMGGLIGIALATLPAALLYRSSVAELLR